MSYNVYCLCDNECKVVYVGSSSNLINRIDQHINDNKDFSMVFYLEYESEETMLEKEKSFISKFKPYYNKKLYSDVGPNQDRVEWLELDSKLFISKIIRRASDKGGSESCNTYYQIPSNILRLRFLILDKVKSVGSQDRVEFTASDKLIYCYMKRRFDSCQQIGVDYNETRSEIAEATGLTSKTVDRFINKMHKHGFIDYSTNNIGNRAVYLKIANLLG